jgi:LacI family transcriptional regulator
MTSRTRPSGVGVVDLASELGISTATVSRALNGSPAVRPELAERIRSHAAERGYVTNRLARGLSSTTTRGFAGLVIPYVDTPAYSAVATECSRLLSKDGTQMILTITSNAPQVERCQLRELVASRFSGLIISPSTGILDESRRILESLPVVELHRASAIYPPCVFSDDREVLADAAAHLVTLGHTDLSYLGTPRQLSHRAEGRHGIADSLVRDSLGPAEASVRFLEPTSNDARRGAEALLAQPRMPTALIVGERALSVGATTAVRTRNVQLPDDLSLIVYGDPRLVRPEQPAADERARVVLTTRPGGVRIAEGVAGQRHGRRARRARSGRAVRRWSHRPPCSEAMT